MSYATMPKRPAGFSFCLGIVFPLAVLIIEAVSGWCAQTFFDPIPTFWHGLAIAVVVAVNGWLWHRAQDEAPVPRWTIIAGSCAVAISLSYTLVFLPLLPIALIAIIFFGLGILPFAPLLALITAIRLLKRLGARAERLWRDVWIGIAIGITALLAIDVPSAATQAAIGMTTSGNAESARNGIALMRWVGDRDMLLRLCYGDDRRAGGLLSSAFAATRTGFFPTFDERSVTSTTAARELYYRVTGAPFNSVSPPTRGRGAESARMFSFDEDQGGTGVGGRLAGLSLASSRIDGSIAAKDNVAYYEWTAEFANSSFQQREARLTLALPKGAVASRVTLWVNGEPREASVAGRGAVRAAYQNIVVNQARDPLLVTTSGADRLLVQAFPVQPNIPMKIRIGISAPFEIARDGTRSLGLPAIVDRNFEMSKDQKHAVWIESRAPLRGSDPAFITSTLADGSIKVRADLSDTQLLTARPQLIADRLTAPETRTTLVKAEGKAPALLIVQTVAPAPAPRPGSLTILLDGSSGNKGAAAAMSKMFDAIPQGLPVAFVIAADRDVVIAAKPWSAAHRATIEGQIAATSFVGGQDNVTALVKALRVSEGAGSALLWVHGPQPVEFAGSLGSLEQLLERRQDLPTLVRYQATPGPEFAIAENRWFEGATHAAATGKPTDDLHKLVGTMMSDAPVWKITRARGSGGSADGSGHIARLWAAQEIAALNPAIEPQRLAAVALAERFNIVTPVSGAVVLETDADYRNNGLKVPGAQDVPTVPEPAEWAMMLIAAALFLWAWRARAAQAVAA
jgi:Vault protein inter-alpha-trypsin domain